MALRRERSVPSPEPTRFAGATLVRMLLALGTLAAALALGREATRPFWSEWYADESAPPPLTTEQIEAMQRPISDNDLYADWTLPTDLVQRLLVSAEAPQGVDAEVDRRWRSVIHSLSPDEKFRLLQTLLVATGEAPPLEPGFDPTLRLSLETLAKLRAEWEGEHADLFEMLVAAPGEASTEEGAKLVRALRERVSRQLDALDAHLQASLEADPSGATTGSSKETLLPVLRAWDGAALAAVKDATANGDPGDFALWYRLFQRLSHVPEKTLDLAAGDRVTEGALARQPDAHRGELFSLVGTARGGKSVKAQPNVLGIERYYVVWVQPDDDRDALIAVYSLSKPEGFPDLPEQAELDRFAIRFEAPVYFLKKFAYEGQETISVSPLVLARSFRFEPPKPDAATGPPSTTALVLAIGLAGAVGIGVVTYVYRKTRRDPHDAEAEPDRLDETVLRKRFVESP